jgi:hypothetical protein
MLIKIQNILLIVISIVFTILCHISYDAKDVNKRLSNTANIKYAQKVLELANGEKTSATAETNALGDRIKAIDQDVAFLKESNNEFVDNTTNNNNSKKNNGAKINALITEKVNIKTNLQPANELRGSAATTAVTNAETALVKASKFDDSNTKAETNAGRNTRLTENETIINALNGRKMQEKSVMLVIISVLVLLLDMNNLLLSKDVGDPLQVVVGVMLFVFGVNVLTRFNKENTTELGSIEFLDKKVRDNITKNTKAAAIFGTIGGFLCIALGVQVLLTSVVKKPLNLKFKKLKGKSAKGKKK